MADAFNLLINIGPVVLLLDLIASITLAAFGFARRDGDKAKWLGR